MKYLLGISFSMVLALFATTLSGQTTESVPIDTINCRVNNEILQANTRLADELFISGQDSLARIHYVEALERLDHYIMTLKCEGNNFYDMAKANIQYRLSLLDNSLDFWGISYNMKPLNPIEHFAKFNSLLGNFETLVADMNQLIVKLGQGEDKVVEDQGLAHLNQTEIDVQTYEKDKQDVKINHYNESIQLARHKIEVMNIRQAQIEQEAKQAVDKIKQLTNGMTTIMLNAVCQSIGLPINPATINLDKSLDKTILSVGSALVTNNPTFRQSLKDISEATDKLITLYQTADSLKDKVESVAREANKLYELVHKPSLDRLINMGLSITAQLDPQQAAQINNHLKTYKSLSSLVHLSHKFPDLKKILSDKFLEFPNARQMAIDYLKQNEEQFSAWVIQSISDVYSGAANEVEKMNVTYLVFRGAADSLFGVLPKEALDYLKTVSGSSDAQQVVDWLKKIDRPELANLITIQGKQLVFKGTGIRTELTTMVKDLKTKYASLPIFNPEDWIVEWCKETLTNAGDHLSKVLEKAIPVSSLTEVANSHLSALNPDQIKQTGDQYYDAILSEIQNKTSLGKQLHQQIDALNIGAYFSCNIGGPTGKTSSDIQVMPVSSSMSKAEMMKQAALTAGIAAACPTIAIAGQFVANWMQRGKMLGKLKELNAENKQITIDKLHTYDLLHELIINERLALLDKQIGEKRKEHARYMFDLYRAKMRRSARSIGLVRLQLNNRKALLFYLNEKLREQYALINKAMLFRHGKSLYEKVTTSPENLRFALDEDISLFRWLDNSVASSRADMDALNVYWKKVQVLIQTNCDECQKNYAPIVNVLETEPVSLRKFFPTEWSAFEKAIRENKTEYDFILPILPGRLQLPDEKKRFNLRMLDVRLGGHIKTENKFVRITDAELLHPGVSYIFDGNNYKKEVFQPDRRTGIEPGPGTTTDLSLWPKPFNIADLQQRWRNQGGLAHNPIEGYGLYSVYSLNIKIREGTRNLDDILIRFAYSFDRTDENFKPDERLMVFKANSASSIPLTNEDLKALGGKKEDWVKRVSMLLSDRNILMANESLVKYEISSANDK